jgi:hypothetical protein
MFVKAIEEAALYTRAIHTISRTYSGIISPGSATLFFVNDEGVAVTCKHVAELIVGADKINTDYEQFKKEKSKYAPDNNYKKNLLSLELKYKLKAENTIQYKNNFIDCVDRSSKLECILHPTLDLAILKFTGYNKLLYRSYARFVKDTSKIKQGRSLCRLGFPFPEFNNFSYNQQTDDIEWIQGGSSNSPSFPIDGIITRFVGGMSEYGEQQITGIELSTPGLRGQSGGPLFDSDGLVYGIQSMTGHLHLGFDIHNMEIVLDGKKAKVSNQPFLHVGICVHAERIKEFLSVNNIKYYEA